MAIRKAQEVLPTLKITVKKNDENGVLFKNCDAVILEVVELPTKHGNKLLATVEVNKEKLNVFINQTSIKNLIEAFGEDDDDWKGETVSLRKEVDEHFDAEMIVFHKK